VFYLKTSDPSVAHVIDRQLIALVSLPLCNVFVLPLNAFVMPFPMRARFQ
jgi:hypothetical protein